MCKVSKIASIKVYSLQENPVQNAQKQIPHLQFACAEKPLYKWYTHCLYSGICECHNLVIHTLSIVQV